MCLFVRISILHLSVILLLQFGTDPTVWLLFYIFYFFTYLYILFISVATSDDGYIDFKSRIKDMSDIIIQSLHLADILDGMVSYCALTVDDRAFIDAQPTLSRKNRMFLEVILSRGDVACEVFIDLLREDGHYDNLVERLCHHVTGYDECDCVQGEIEHFEGKR